jgi:ferredoxin
MRRIVKVLVDRDECLWHRACALAPRVFVDVGESWPVVPDDVGILLEADREQIIEAALSCPVAAISVEFEDGKSITSADWNSKLGLQQWLKY